MAKFADESAAAATLVMTAIDAVVKLPARDATAVPALDSTEADPEVATNDPPDSPALLRRLAPAVPAFERTEAEPEVPIKEPALSPPLPKNPA